MKNIAAWQILVPKFFKSKEEASRYIYAGKVHTAYSRIEKPGQMIPVDSVIFIKDYDKKYVSRGGFKLEGALKDLNVPVENSIALDAGASTGGFTDCLLQSGATKVYSVDAGFGQFSGKLRNDKRVVCYERTNISNPKLLLLNPRPELIVADLSYISLKKAIPVLADIIERNGRMLCLIKPFFEMKNTSNIKPGSDEDATAFQKIIDDIVLFINSLNMKVLGTTESRIKGGRGTKEFFIYIIAEG